MRSDYAVRNVVAAVVCTVLLSPLLVNAQECSRRAVVQSDTDIYRYPPRYVTGAGWRGERVDIATKGTQVLICGERTVPFGLSSKIWSQVAYRRGTAWLYGWILQERAAPLSTGKREAEQTAQNRPVFLRVAYQGLTYAAVDETEGWTIPKTAPAPTGAADGAIPAAASPVDSTDLAELLTLYWPLFVAMLLGMFAKAVVDLVDEWDKALAYIHARRGVIAVLVSPIVFLGFLNAGQFEGSKQTFLVLLLLSFQNGFFWQTVLKREGPRAPSRGAASSVATGQT